MVCRARRTKDALVRVALLADGQAAIDPTGKGAGRGAYVCRSGTCWSDERIGAKLCRALKAPLSGANLANLVEYGRTLPEDAADANRGD